jgi:hypothetical protein
VKVLPKILPRWGEENLSRTGGNGGATAVRLAFAETEMLLEVAHVDF